MPKMSPTPSRISREDLFSKVAELYGQRSTCPRASVGVVAVRDGRIVAAGYNGAPAGHKHCYEVGCELTQEVARPDEMNMEIVEHCIRSVHAEANMISWAAREGIKLQGTVIYLTHTPCQHCAKLLINADIRSVHIKNAYGHQGGVELLYASSILVFG